MKTREETEDRTRVARAGGRRRGPPGSVLALQKMAGNRAVGQLMRSPFDQQPEGVTAGADALPAGATTDDHDTASIEKGRVGDVDRVMLDGLSGTQGGKSWGSAAKASKGHVGAVGPGKAGHRGRAVALVPHGMKGGGPVSVVVHFHGIDVGKYAGSSGMRETGDRPEDVEFFQLPQQLQAFTKKHAGARVVVLMPLGATVKAGKGFTSSFGLGDMDTFVDECLGELGLGGGGGTVYLSSHSGGGFTISELVDDPSRLPQRYRFGGVFGFESFHGDTGTWAKLVTDRLDADLGKLEGLRGAGGSDDDISKAQLAYLRNFGFRFAAFSGKTYETNLTKLRNTILDWFKKHRRRLRKATGDAHVLDQLWRNYQAIYAQEEHMQALSKDSHFESVLESLAGGAPAAAAPAPHTVDEPPPHKDPVRHADEVHKHEPPPPPAKTAAAAPADASADKPFRLQHYPSDKDDVKNAAKLKVLVPKKGHKREIAKPPTEYLVDVLRVAGVPNPEKWFDQFTTDLRFLGHRFKQPIHKLLAEHLRKVEHDLAKDFGGDPAAAGTALGLEEDIIGARAYPTVAPISMHMFGLAIDVNYKRNPMVHPNAAENKVFARAGELIDPDAKKKAKLTTSMSYAEASRLNKLITDYFKLAKDPTALAKKLEHAGGFWTGMKVEDAQKQIEDDLGGKSGLVERWARGNKDPKIRAQSVERIRTEGFLALKEELVRGLKMNWGGAYGDMMHFDLRDDGGQGQAIYSAINRYFAQLRKKADAPDPPAGAPPAA